MTRALPPRPCRRVAIIGPCLDSSTFAASLAAGSGSGRRREDTGGSFDGSFDDDDGLEEIEPDTPVDIVVHSLSYPLTPTPAGGAAQQQQQQPGGAPRTAARMAGATAAALGSKEVVLWQGQARFLQTPEGCDDALPGEAAAEAREALGGPEAAVSFAGAFWCYQPERQEEEEPQWESDSDGEAAPAP